MKTHNASIYHCISCGRVEHAELKAELPQCCGQPMAIAAAETIGEGDVTGEKVGGQTETATPVIAARE